MNPGYIAPTVIALFTAAAMPANAGSLSVELEPRNAEEETAMRVGLALYGLAKGSDDQAQVNQNGQDNAAAVGQRGDGHTGVIEQQGDDHEATLQQNGNDNAYGIFQTGEGGNAHVAQNGDGETGLLFQHSW